MLTLDTIAAVRAHVTAWKRAGERVALVPTMGNLHAGHLSLVDIAHRHASRVVVSVFVNPLQFGPHEDFHRYPRTLAEDSAALSRHRADLLFAPTPAEMYPDADGDPTRVEVPGVSADLEGAIRPGHFSGVATVVTKLFGIATPDVAVFGAKDFQQLAVIRKLTADLALGVEIVSGPIVRAADGLALSSRNQYLTPEERARAPRLQATLQAAAQRVAQAREALAEIESDAIAALRADGFAPDYVVVRRASDLRVPAGQDRDLVILAAARLGTTRLLDNVEVMVTAGR